MNLNFDTNNPRVRAALGSLILALAVVFLFLIISIAKNTKNKITPAPGKSAPVQENVYSPISVDEAKKILNQKADNYLPPISEEEAEKILNTGADDFEESQ